MKRWSPAQGFARNRNSAMAPYTVPTAHAHRDPVIAPLMAQADAPAAAPTPRMAPVAPVLPAAPTLPLNPADPANRQSTRTSSSANFQDSIARGRQDAARRAGDLAANAGLSNVAKGAVPTRPQGTGKARIVTADGQVHERQFTPAPVETREQLGRRQLQTAARQYGREEELQVQRGVDPLPRDLARDHNSRANDVAAADAEAGRAEAVQRASQAGLYDAQAESEQFLRGPNAAKAYGEAYSNFNNPSQKLAEGRAELAEQALQNQQRLTHDTAARDRTNRPPKPAPDTTLNDLAKLQEAAKVAGDREGAAAAYQQMQEFLSGRKLAPAGVAPEEGDGLGEPPGDFTNMQYDWSGLAPAGPDTSGVRSAPMPAPGPPQGWSSGVGSTAMPPAPAVNGGPAAVPMPLLAPAGFDLPSGLPAGFMSQQQPTGGVAEGQTANGGKFVYRGGRWIDVATGAPYGG